MEFLIAGSDQRSEFGIVVRGAEVLKDHVTAVLALSDLHGRRTRRRLHLP
jgi:hypothetical protein